MQFFQLFMDHCSSEVLFDFRSEGDIIFTFFQCKHSSLNSYKLETVFFALEIRNLFLFVSEHRLYSNSKFCLTTRLLQYYAVVLDKSMNLS